MRTKASHPPPKSPYETGLSMSMSVVLLLASYPAPPAKGLMGESRLPCLKALFVSSGQKSLAQQLGAELKIQIVNGIAKTVEAHRTH